MNTSFVAGLTSAILMLLPTLAFASFTDTAQRAQAQANSLSADQLDDLNTRVVNDAFVTAKIIGYDPAEIKQLRADVAQLRQENAQLRAQIQGAPAVTASVIPVSLETRVTKLEAAFENLQRTLKLVINMLTALLAKL
jgi:hypothetical protein